MLSITDAVHDLVIKSPFLEEALGTGIINLSALARKIHSRIEDKVRKDVKDGAIVVALKRLSSQINKKIKPSR